MGKKNPHLEQDFVPKRRNGRAVQDEWSLMPLTFHLVVCWFLWERVPYQGLSIGFGCVNVYTVCPCLTPISAIVVTTFMNPS